MSRYLALLDDRPQTGSKDRETRSSGAYSRWRPTSKGSDTASLFRVPPGQAVLAHLTCHCPVCLRSRTEPCSFLCGTDGSGIRWAPRKPWSHWPSSEMQSERFVYGWWYWQANRSVPLFSLMGWIERFGCQTSVRPHFSSLPHRVPLAAANIWLWLICQGWLYNGNGEMDCQLQLVFSQPAWQTRAFLQGWQPQNTLDLAWEGRNPFSSVF